MILLLFSVLICSIYFCLFCIFLQWYMDEENHSRWLDKIHFLTMPKKGDITKCENYRTISLINHSSKILLEIIRSRMKPYVEAILAEEQARFRPGRSTLEQVFALKMLIQHRIEKERQDGICCVQRLQEGFWQSLVWWPVFLYYSSMVSLENSSTSSVISTVKPKAALEWTTISLTGLKQRYVSGRAVFSHQISLTCF